MGSIKTVLFSLLTILMVNFVNPVFANGTVTLRKKDTPCGLYLSSLNSGTGRKVADLTIESIDAFFAANPDLEATITILNAEDLKPITDFETVKNALANKAVTTEKQDQYLFLVGLPFPKKESQPLIDHVEAKVAEQDLDFPPQVIPLRRPSSVGIKRVGEEMLYLLFPFPSDWAKPSKTELWKGITSVAISSGITIGTQTWLLGPKIGIPAGIMNMIFSISTSLPRPLWMNYFTKHNAEADKWIKQIFMTTYFTAGVYWASKVYSPDLAQILSLQAWGAMLLLKSPSILFQTFWRKPMEHGLATFVEEQTKVGNHEDAKNVAASIRRWGTIFSTNAWLVSVLYGKPLFHAGIDWNWGHVGMLISTGVFMFMEKHPEWYYVENKDFRKAKYAAAKIKLADVWKEMKSKILKKKAPPPDDVSLK